jgi:kynurenine formamidase
MSVLGGETAEAAIAAAAERVSNWGRWGDDDIRGTLNFVDEERRRAAAGLVRQGRALSLSISLDIFGPQNGDLGRFNPVHTMSKVVTEPSSEFPHGFGGADDMLMMPMQAATHWDGLGHIFDRGRAYNGREARNVVTVDGDGVTGIDQVTDAFVARAVLLDVGHRFGDDGELPDGFAITPEMLDEVIAAQGPSSAVGRGDVVLLRTGQMTRCRREGWGGYAGGDAPGLSFTTVDWIHEREIAAVASDTWGVEVRPNEFAAAYQPWHQVVIPHIGLYVGELFALDVLAAACADDGVYEVLLVAPPLAVTGGVGAPANPIAIR